MNRSEIKWYLPAAITTMRSKKMAENETEELVMMIFFFFFSPDNRIDRILLRSSDSHYLWLDLYWVCCALINFLNFISKYFKICKYLAWRTKYAMLLTFFMSFKDEIEAISRIRLIENKLFFTFALPLILTFFIKELHMQK